jgi:KDO2-lipid IV(A) lauroyltransferase
MAAFLYYLIIFPFSFLPLRALYLFADLFYYFTIGIYSYRRKVIDQNLERSFPELSQKERNLIRTRFYRHFSDLLIEGVKNLSISKAELGKRMVVKNASIMTELHEKGKSVILVSGHYNNWEWLITSQSFLFPHKAMGIGMPLTSKFWDKKINQRRQRFGMQVVHARNFKEAIRELNGDPVAILTLGDQSPPDAKKSYWTDFLHQKTAVLFGTEQMAHEFNFAVVYFIVRKVKRGYYEMELKLLCEDPKKMSWGEITEQHTKLLEKEILEHPSYWIWSHKRWKRDIPTDLPELQKEQQKKFNDRFKTI